MCLFACLLTNRVGPVFPRPPIRSGLTGSGRDRGKVPPENPIQGGERWIVQLSAPQAGPNQNGIPSLPELSIGCDPPRLCERCRTSSLPSKKQRTTAPPLRPPTGGGGEKA